MKWTKFVTAVKGMRNTFAVLFLESWPVTLTTTPLFLHLNSWNKIKKSIAVMTLQLASLLYINNSVSYYFRISFIIHFTIRCSQIFFSKLSWSYLKIQGAGRVTWNTSHVEIPQMLVATATCRPILCTPVTRDILYIMRLFCCLHFSFFPFQLDHPLLIINVPYSLCVLGISFLSPLLLRYSFLFSLFIFCVLDVFLLASIWAKSLRYACFQASTAK